MRRYWQLKTRAGGLWAVSPTARFNPSRAAAFGALLVIVGQLLSLPTVLASEIRPGQRPPMLILSALNAPTSVALVHFVPWSRIHRRWLLVWPMWTIVGVGAAAVHTFVHGSPTLTGLFVVAFFYIGLSQRRGTSLLCLPIAIPCWVATSGGWQRDLWLSAPLAVGVWIIVAETIAALRAKVEGMADGLVKDAGTDSLTGLANRRSLAPTIASLVDGDAVVLLDIDHFKALNDQFGHQAGDKVLVDLSRCIGSVVRPTDIAMRIGGEEFLLILRNAQAVGAREVLARCTNRWSSIQPGVTFSAGISVVGAIAPSDAVAAADGALYQAKIGGRACSVVAESDRGTGILGH